MEPEILQKLDKFLFLISSKDQNQLSSKCFWYFTLTRTNIMLSLFGIWGSFYGIYLGLTSDVAVLTFIYCGLDIISFITCIMILASCFNKNAYLAYYGYAISSMKMILYFFVYIIYLIIFKMALGFNYFDDPFDSEKSTQSKLLETLFKIPVTLYFLWMNFSFTKHLALGNWDLVDGKQKVS